MKKTLHAALKILIYLVIAASVILNIYYFGFIKLKTKYQQEGFNSALQAIVQTVNQIGEVKIGDVILIKK